AAKKTLKSYKFRRARRPDEHCASATIFDERNTAKDKSSHHDLAHLGRTDHQGAHMGSVEWQRHTSFGTSPGRSQCRRPGKLADLARELPETKTGDRRFMTEAIPAHHGNRTLEDEPGWNVTRADVVDDFIGCEFPRRPARKALRYVDLARIKDGKH